MTRTFGYRTLDQTPYDASEKAEPKNAPELPIGRFLNLKSLGGNRVILVDYEVLGLQVTVATVFGNCFGAYIFSWSFSRCQQRSRGDVRSPYVANIEPTQWMAPVAFVHELQGIVIPPTLLRNCQG